MNEEDDDEKRETPRKKPYAAPRLIEYGRAVDLTGGGTGSVSEGAGMAAMKQMP